MTNKWVVLSETEAECIEQSKMYVTSPPIVPLLNGFVRPVLQNLGGKHAPLFPLYIQCRSSKDAEEVLQLHEPLLELYASHPDRMELARAIYRTLECPNILSGVAWYVLLNGRSFRGLLFSTTYVISILYSVLIINPTLAAISTPRLEISNTRHGVRRIHLKMHC